MPEFNKVIVSGDKRKLSDRRQKSKYETGYKGAERRICNRRVKDRATDLRKQIKKDKERNKVDYAFRLREKDKKKNSFLSEERCLIKNQKKILDILNTNKLSEEERSRLSRELALLYKLSLNIPAKEQLLSWRKNDLISNKSTIDYINKTANNKTVNKDNKKESNKINKKG